LALPFTVTFSIKKVEAQCAGKFCIYSPCPPGCLCKVSIVPPVGVCVPGSYKDAVKIVGENLIYQNNTECKNNGTIKNK
jgi:hypothetical protein